MKPRTCRIVIRISNDSGSSSCYCLRPLAPAELGASAAGFRLENLTDPPHALYAVRVDAEGVVSCTCPQHNFKSACKHASALVAAGLLPVGLLALLKSRSQLLNHAEAEVLRVTEAAIEERKVYDHDEQWRADRITDLNERIEQLETELEARKPKPRRRRPEGRVRRFWLWLWTEAVMFAALVLPERDANAVEAWCLRRRRPRPWSPPSPPVIAAEGDTPASVKARREALIRLFRQLHGRGRP